MAMPWKKIIFFTIILASIFIINSLIHSIISLWQKNDLVVRAKQELVKQEKENTELKKTLTEVKKPEFMEEEVRNKLFMAKTGEGVIVLPKNYESEVNKIKEQPISQKKPNWQQWWETFF